MPILSWTENYGNEIFEGYNLTSLKRDEYYLDIFTNATKKSVNIYSTFEDCIKCPYKKIAETTARYTSVHSSEFKKLFRISYDDSEVLPRSANNVICDINKDFGEFGIYRIYVQRKQCEIVTLKDSVNIYIPIFTVFLIYTTLICLVYLLGYIHRKFVRKSKTGSPQEPKKERVKSLDTFRGISIVLMIFVNYGCGGYAILEHALWNGLHLADVIFPWFLWIMGVCIPISVASSNRRGVSREAAVLNIVRRSCILFALGLFLGASPYLDTARIFGVLQRFGICYFVVATLRIIFYSKQPLAEGKFKKHFDDICRLEFEWITMLLILILHEYLNYSVAAPGCPRGYNGPGGNHNNGKYINCTGGASGYIDRTILGTSHIYQNPTIRHVYESLPFDPEGILGTLTSIIQVFFGVQAGVTLMVYKEHKQRLYRWALWGLITGLVGGALCEFKKDDGLIPINKNLWSLSFVLITTSLAFFLLCVCYYIVDVKKWWSGKPFLFAGMNATIMYVGHSVTSANFIIHWYFSKELANRTHFLTLMDNVWATGVWILIAYYLYRMKFFLSI